MMHPISILYLFEATKTKFKIIMLSKTPCLIAAAGEDGVGGAAQGEQLAGEGGGAQHRGRHVHHQRV